jgi:hypothetical protein
MRDHTFDVTPTPHIPVLTTEMVCVDNKRILVVKPNVVETHLTAIRNEFSRVDQQQGITDVIIERLQAEIKQLSALTTEYKKRFEEAEATIAKIRGHL